MNMTDDEIRIAIAEACGWKPPYSMTSLCEWIGPHGKNLSDPLEDLNSCQAMQKAITDPCQRKAYWLYLDHDVDATARQRCIAFLKTIGKL